MLSLRAWDDAARRYCHRYLHVAAESQTWTTAVEPIVLQLVRELLLLFTAVLQHARRDVVDALVQVQSLCFALSSPFV